MNEESLPPGSLPGGPDRTDPALAGPSPQAFRHRTYVLFWAGRLFATMAAQIVAVAVAWQIYDLTRSTFALGLVGLVQFLPSAVLVLITGAAADRFSRRGIMMACLGLEAVAAAILLGLTVAGVPALWPVYAAILILGVARAFYSPASSSLVPSLVPSVALASAITWVSSAWQVATIVGPVIGGLLYDLSPVIPNAVGLALFLLSAAMVAMISPRQRTRGARNGGAGQVVAGFRYVWHEKVVLGAISLDLFAVLLGGATALLPAIARDVLHTGPWGLGLLRSAPGFGAVAVAALLSFFPIRDHAGRIMFVCVAIFGVATAVFGWSDVLWLSIAASVVMGASDMVSVVVRETLIQLWTPDEVRGRVTAVNAVFVGASNEIGEFRAGMSAALIGVVPAIVVGGIGTVVVAGLWAWLFPQLRDARRLDAPRR